MALQAQISAEVYAALPDALKGEYKVDGGQYKLDVVAVDGLSLENVTGLKSALEAERATARDAKAVAKSFEGLDAAKARDAMKKLEEMANFDPEAQVAEKIKAREAQMVTRHQEELDASKAKSTGLHSQLEGMLITSAATEALQAANGSIALLLPHVKSQVRMRQVEDGRLIAEVIDANTGHARVGDGAGNPMTIPQLVSEMKANQDFAAGFTGTGQSGTGAASGGTTGNPSRPAAGTAPGAVKTVSRQDQVAMNSNWEGIASGEVVVVD